MKTIPLRRSRLAAVHVVVVGLVLWPALQTAEAVENCKARKRRSDGTISIRADNIVGQLKWGTSAGAENLPFADEELCLGGQRARGCFLSDDGVSRRSQDPNTECTVYLADDGGVACSAVIRRCGQAAENSPPHCPSAFATTEVLWPPDHNLREVGIAGVGDLDGDPISITVIAIAQDERVTSPSDSSCPDGAGIGTSTAQIRAERSQFGDGHVYRIRFEATDGRGGSCRGNVRVCVPRNDPEEPCIDQGRIFNSIGPCP